MIEKIHSRERNDGMGEKRTFFLGDSLSKGMGYISAGIEGGKETGWMLRVLKRSIAGIASKDTIFALGGTNDLFNHKSPDSVIRNIEEMKNIAEQNGKIFIPATIPYMNRARESQGSASTETINNGIEKVNNYIRTHFSRYVDFNNLLKDSRTKKIHHLYANKDGIHLNANGYNLMKQEVNNILNNINPISTPNQAEVQSQKTDAYKTEKKGVEDKSKEEIEKTKQNITNQIDALKLSLAEAKTDTEKFELQRQIVRLKKFIALQNGEGIADENLKKEIVELLKGKTPDNYKNADLLTLKNRGIDIATLLLVDKNSENEVVSSQMKEGDEFVVNFGNNFHFARRTGAGDLLPATIREVEINGIKGIRGNNPRPGYYTESGKYLPIFDNYNIKITKIGNETEDDNKAIKNRFQESLNFVEPEKYKFTKLIDISELEKGDKGLLDFIAKAEGTYDNYNAIFGDGKQNKIDFTNMTLHDVIQYQRMHGKKTGSSAIGRYQFIRDTLETLIVKHGISRSEKFSPELQDKLAISLLEEKGFSKFKNGNMSYEAFQLNIAKIWASVAKDDSGLSYYHGDKMNNKATRVGREVAQVLRHLYPLENKQESRTA